MLQNCPTIALSLVLAALAAGATLSAAAAVEGPQMQQAPSPLILAPGAGLGAASPLVAPGNGGGIGGMGPSGGDFGDFGDGMGPPDPSKFRTPEELKEYLERLQLYYALVGRPRFGKRSSSYRLLGGRMSDSSRSYEPADDTDQVEGADIVRAAEAGKTFRDRVRGLVLLF